MTDRKYEKPIKLDVNFNEALNRFAKVDVNEAATIISRGDNEPVHLVEDEATGDQLLIHATDSGIQVEFHYASNTLWMTQAQISELFDRDRSSISKHINNILDDNELEESSSVQKVHKSHGRPATLYNLDMIISVGYRVSSKQATMFRRWATDKLVQFATKGFVIDVERLKDSDNYDHFKELHEIIRDIRASEKNLYKEVRRICAICQDYRLMDGKEKSLFFAKVQNKLHYAVTGMTGAEIRYERADANQELMGLTSFSGNHPIQKDVLTAKNFLGEMEVKDLNRFTGMLLDYFEQETELRRLVTMADANAKLDVFIKNNERTLLRGLGQVSKLQADRRAKAQYALYKEKVRLLAHEESMKGD